MTVSDAVAVRRDAGIVTVVLDRPHKKNAVNDSMMRGLLAAFDDIARRADDRVVVLTGAGDDFCAGADLDDPVAPDAAPVERMNRFTDLCVALRRLPQPSIARVVGAAYGGGFNLALGADLVLVSDDARLCQVFARRGMSVDCGGSWLLPRLVGLHRANELILLADEVSGLDAARLGVVNRSVPRADLDAVVHDWATRLAAGPPHAMHQSKRLLQHALGATFDAALHAEGLAQALNLAGPEVAEALAAFRERRPPVFEPRREE